MKDIIPHALWITPKFSPQEIAGTAPPPHINMNRIDWITILAYLENKFKALEKGVTLRIANDAIDQVTIHMKEIGQLQGTVECFEFGNALQKKAKRTKQKVIPIQQEWKSLHFIKNRNSAPPPIMIPLIMSGQVEDIILFVRDIQICLGIRMATDINLMLSKSPLTEDNTQGHLTTDLTDLFEKHFNVAFESFSIITPLVQIDKSKI